MTVQLVASRPSTFEIKSANLPLIALQLKSSDLYRFEQEFAGRFKDMPAFFDDDPMLVDLTPLAGDAVVDFHALRGILGPYKVRAIAVKGGSDAQRAAAIEAGLVVATDARTVEPAPAPQAESPKPQPAQVVLVPTTPTAPLDPMIVDRPLRSGQQVYARGRDLILLAMVNPGAEVIADGNIHVYAPLRGKAIAGARGNADARIFTLSLEPELLAIAGLYRTSDVPFPKELLAKPAQVRLVGGTDGKMVIDPIKG